MMRSCKDPPSMLELCEIFKKKRELLCGLNDGSELDEHPCYRKILARSSRVNTTVEERGKAMEVGTGQPSRSRKTQHSTRISLSREKEDLLDDTTVERRRDLRFSHIEKLTEVSDSEDNESFSEEEFYPDSFDENSLTPAALKQNREMSPQQRDEERLHRNAMTQAGRRRDIRRYLPHESACSSSRANAPGYSHCELQNRSERKASQPHFQGSDVFVQRRQNMGSSKRSHKQISNLQPPVQRFTRNVAAVPRQLHSTAEEQRTRPVLFVHQRCCRQGADCEENSHNRSRRIGMCQRTDETREHGTFVRVLRKRF